MWKWYQQGAGGLEAGASDLRDITHPVTANTMMLARGAKDKEHAMSWVIDTSTFRANEPFAMQQLMVAK